MKNTMIELENSIGNFKSRVDETEKKKKLANSQTDHWKLSSLRKEKQSEKTHKTHLTSSTKSTYALQRSREYKRSTKKLKS